MIGLISVATAFVFLHKVCKPDEVKKPCILKIDLDNVLDHEGPQNPVAAFLGDCRLSFFQLINVLEKAATEDKIRCVYITCRSYPFGMAQTQELRKFISIVKKKKPVYFFSPSIGDVSGGNMSYYLASAASHICVQPVGGLGVNGFGIEMLFFKNMFNKIRVNPEFFGREEYKSAIEPYTRSDMSKHNREAISSILTSMENNVANDLLEDARVSRGKHNIKDVFKFLRNGPYTSIESLEMKFVDSVRLQYELEEELRKKFSEDVVSEVSYAKSVKAGNSRKSIKPTVMIGKSGIPCIAVMSLSGEIVGGSNRGFGNGIFAADIIEKLEEVAEDKSIKAIVIRVDSPGGDAVASEEIYGAIEKYRVGGVPVIVSMGNYAASGGYLISLAGDYIFAEPSTITGSIGVFSGKFDLSGLLSAMGISVDHYKLSEHTFMSSSNRGFTKEGIKKMMSHIDSTYQRFLSLVSYRRKIKFDEARKSAKGRVWTGEQAKKLMLVDEMGGMSDAIKKAKDIVAKKDGIPLKDILVKDISQPEGIVSAIFDGDGMRALFSRIFVSLVLNVDKNSQKVYMIEERFTNRMLNH
ncbi:signal peptide peptidase SppA [Candidatus Hydrogenosomobacter endosymbioticus]|uniref:signal peptide peptidase SppA n=1 Tax=Candidatus Hydrogenosomobacter endosymbioticus TaxID=2558174 RepID=UPI001F00CC6A|nr:signal peptide peptidase SppA [Candidatus Hydrogenosomobacter endosymbioticus]